MIDPANLMTPTEAARHHGITLKAVYLAAHDGRIKTVPVGRLMLDRASVMAWVPRPNVRRRASAFQGNPITDTEKKCDLCHKKRASALILCDISYIIEA